MLPPSIVTVRADRVTDMEKGDPWETFTKKVSSPRLASSALKRKEAPGLFSKDMSSEAVRFWRRPKVAVRTS